MNVLLQNFSLTTIILAVVDWIENTLIPSFFNHYQPCVRWAGYEFIMNSVPQRVLQKYISFIRNFTSTYLKKPVPILFSIEIAFLFVQELYVPDLSFVTLFYFIF
ncbi:hypothetical protein HMPREF2585_04405 [Staphylococcus sp. HMSC062D12]|nr:hypothetical protein HMPREF2585_04405 [Staphylococcus sp. HMSC062D12]